MSMQRIRQLLAQDDGLAAIELAILAAPIVGILGLGIFAGRISTATNAVQQAADDAARQASISRTSAQAQTAARTSAAATLNAQNLHCVPTITIDTSGFSRPVGQPAQVRTTITCTVSTADVSIPGIPGNRTITASSVSPIDPWRGTR